MELRNIHFQAPADEAAAQTPVNAPALLSETRLRLRKTKVSPHEEHALRPGETRPISDALASLICCRKGRAEIGPRGITVERKDIGGKRIYHHVDSILCNDLSQRERKIYYVLNSLKPDVIHLLDDTGRYIESLPEKAMPGVLDQAAQEKEYRDQKRQVNRVARHLQELHGEDTKDAIAALAHNAEVMKGIVQVLDRPSPAPANAPAPSPLGERVRNGERRINDMRSHQLSTAALGRALSMNRRDSIPSGPAEYSEYAEDWSDSPTRTNQQQAPIESW